MCVKPRLLRTLHVHVPNIFLCGVELCSVHDHKYVGVIFSDDKSDVKDDYREMRSMHAKVNLLLRSFHKCSVSVKENIFKAYFSDFFIELWSSYPLSVLKKLRTAFRNIFYSLWAFP